MFQKILSGSTTPAVAPSTYSSDTPDRPGSSVDGDDEHSIHGSSASPAGSRPSSHKKRSRRRRKAKSRSKVEPLWSKAANAASSSSSSKKKKNHDAPMTKRDLYFALDCEMVGVGPDGLTSAVARVSIVNWENQIILDTYVQVPVPVTDYRTHVSGITPDHLQPGSGHPLMTFSQVRETVQTILRGKILIGHGLENDLKALGLYHPWCDIRDTATYSYYMREHRDPVTDCVTLVPKKLRDLAWETLNRQIQDPGTPHSPIEDAIAALDLYKESRGQWEDHLIQVARQKESEQQQQLLETQQQQQQQQMRRWQWLAGNGAPQQMYPGGNQHPMGVPMHPHMSMHQQPPPPQATSFRYPAMAAVPMMMMQQQPSPAAAAYLQQQQSPQQQQQQTSRSSWFGFSRRPKNNNQTRMIPPVFSQDSIVTSPTMTTVQSSFSMDQSSVAPSPRGAHNMPFADGYTHQHQQQHYHSQQQQQHQIASEASEEQVLEEGVAETSRENAKSPEDDPTAPEMEATESSSSFEAPSLPEHYEPPKYFTPENPNPNASSSWFKLWSSSNKGSKNEDCGNLQEVAEKERKRRSSDSEATTLALFASMSLFPRRSSENSIADMGNAQSKEQDEHSRSMH